MNKKFTKKELEYFSCATSLSDMEIFIFPDLMYSLVIANILSPEIWKWKNDKWFEKIEKKSFNYKVNRVKQYIMEHFVFNLDLDTWGLTTKEAEINRFKDFIDMAALSQSNALFGYEGDKYYFDIDIRRHFGLEKYDTDVIPYWKTETVEAMQAFKYKEGYGVGAGECVSLAALYVAAMYVVGGIPLEKMYLIATPLHSQNFIAEKDGLLTNNRRIVTKNMWYNGTEISAKARRAVENEKITIVSHITGHIHTYYKEASIAKEAYTLFKDKFKSYLKTELNFETFANFLFSEEKYWKCFQYKHTHTGKDCFIGMNSIFKTQQNSKNRFGNDTRTVLMGEMEMQEFSNSPLDGETMINDIETYLNANPDLDFEQYKSYFFNELFLAPCANVKDLFKELELFLHIEPRLPNEEEKVFVEADNENGLHIEVGMEREEIYNYVRQKAVDGNKMAELSLYAFRDMDFVDYNEPFFKAAFERNPVCIMESKDMELSDLLSEIAQFEDLSIYSDNRLAQPDEVWNFKRGDGLEKAILLVNILKKRGYSAIRIHIKDRVVNLTSDRLKDDLVFTTDKTIEFDIIF